MIVKVQRFFIKQICAGALAIWFAYGYLNATAFCFSEMRYVPQLELCRRAHPEYDIKYDASSKEYRKARAKALLERGGNLLRFRRYSNMPSQWRRFIWSLLPSIPVVIWTASSISHVEVTAISSAKD